MNSRRLEPVTADGAPRCQARTIGGHILDERPQCMSKAKKGKALCGTHLRKAELAASRRTPTREET